ncbi:MAG: ATP-binding protein [Cyclobacteriaceae bacterium]
MKITRSFRLKTKIIIGFGLVLIAVMGVALIALDSYEKLSDAVQTLSQPDEKLEQIDSLLVTINSAETLLQHYTLSRSSANLESYEQLVLKIKDKVSELKQQSAYEDAELDSILRLIDVRLVSMDKFREIREQRSDFRFYDKVLEQLEQDKTNRKSTLSLPQDTTQTAPDTIRKRSRLDKKESGETEVNEEEEKERQGIIRWFGRLFSRQKEEKNKQPEDAIRDTLPERKRERINNETAPLAKAETLDTLQDIPVDSIRNMLLELKSEQAVTEDFLNRQEMEYLANNSRVIDRINQLLSKLKKDEQQMNKQQSAEARNILEFSLSRLGIIMLIALGSTLIFVYFIFSDIAKSDSLKQQLENARTKAEKLARVKEDFLANMSHEIRTPLTAILGFASQLKKTPKTPQQEEYVQAIDSSSHHLLALVNDILDFSKIEAGQLQFENKPFDISHLLKEVVRDMRIKAEEKGLILSLQSSSELPPFLKGDAFRLRQVLYNLVSNAIKFTEAGEVKLSCQLSHLEKGIIKAQLVVADSGIGIPKKKQAVIFDAFMQSDVSDTRKYGGTGLGLSICKRIVEAQGGEIALESEVSKGTTFYVALPFEAALEEEVISMQTTGEELSEVHFAEGTQVLVIDDDQLNIRLLRLIIEAWGIKVISAQSGEEGIMLAAKYKPELVLSDLQMPAMPGEEVVRAIREMGMDTLPVVAFTARVTEDMAFFKERGFADVLLKPFDEAGVKNILIKFLPIEKISQKEAPAPNATPVLQQELLPLLPELPEEEELFSLKNIQRFTGDDEEAMQEFLMAFLEVIDQAGEKMLLALEEEDVEGVAYYAHKIMPNVQQLEVKELTELLRELESYRDQAPESGEFRRQVEQTEVLRAKLSQALKARIEKLKQPG